MRGLYLGIAATIVLTILAGLWLNTSLQQSADQRFTAPGSVRL